MHVSYIQDFDCFELVHTNTPVHVRVTLTYDQLQGLQISILEAMISQAAHKVSSAKEEEQ